MEKSPQELNRNVLSDSIAKYKQVEWNFFKMFIPSPRLSTACQTPKSKFQLETRKDFSRLLLSHPQLNEEELGRTQSVWS